MKSRGSDSETDRHVSYHSEVVVVGCACNIASVKSPETRLLSQALPYWLLLLTTNTLLVLYSHSGLR